MDVVVEEGVVQDAVEGVLQEADKQVPLMFVNIKNRIFKSIKILAGHDKAPVPPEDILVRHTF